MNVLKRVLRRLLRVTESNSFEFWENRARTYGPRSVLNLNHSESETESVTAKQEREIFPHLRRQLSGDEKLVIDFGCGPGRFTPALARLTGAKVLGVDPTDKLLQWAPSNDNVSYHRLVDCRIPVETHSADVIWVCLVLGAISGEILSKTIAEFNRTLRPGGLLFIVENTADKLSSKFWTFRSIEQYRNMFPYCDLSHLGDYEDLQERISIFAGRKGEWRSIECCVGSGAVNE